MADKSPRAIKEEEILSFWKENKIFEKSLEKGDKEFVFYDGPPFATGLPHYGHILPGTMKDVIPRYKTMRGYKVSRRWGWDCHGLPIENLVEKELGLETKKDIEKYGIAEFNKRARESVLRYEKDWKEIIPRTGRWIDMDNAYKTMDSSYTESVWWSFKTLYDKGLVYQGFKPMHLCPHCETTLSNFEVNQGYKDITDISVYVKFELVDEPRTYLLAWTTTPWTLPGNVALAVNPNIEYVQFEYDGSNYISSLDFYKKGGNIDPNKKLPALVKSFNGRDLIGKKYKPVFDYYLKESKVYGADFVTSEDGTGIVHIAPAFGEDDYNLSLKENLPFVQHVGTDGRFKSEVKDFAGLKVKPKEDHQAGDVEIIKYLAGKGTLFGKEKIIHSYPHCWRCDTPLLNYASSSWFVKVTDIKNKLVSGNKDVKWVPEDIRDGRFGKWLEGARDWAVSRSRFWGAPLPVWQNSDNSKSLVIDSVKSLKRYSKKSGNKYFVMRHGRAQNNELNVASGKAENQHHLTEDGREMVLKNAKEFKEKVDLIFVSPFVRTKETAEIVRETLGVSSESVIVDERLRELNFGEFEGKSIDEYQKVYPNTPDLFDKHPSGGENEQDVKKRVGDFLYEIENKYSGKTILIVSHGDPVWMASSVTEGASIPKMLWILAEHYPKYAEINELKFIPLPHNENFELDLHRPYIDEVVLEKDGEEYRRVPEVFDTWYDSGSVPFASRASRDFRPADFIAEGLDQTRGWFYTLGVLSTALFGKFPYKQVVVNGLVLAEDGKKMSKRLKNYPELTDVLDKYGADALRYYLMSSQAVRAEDLAFSEKSLDEVMKKNINRLENVLSFYELYIGEDKVIPGKNEHILDQWIDARLNQLIVDVTEGLERYEIDRGARPIADFIDDLSTWYLRRSRTRPEALPKLRQVLITFSRVIAPFMPFMAEDIYKRLKGEKESVHLETWPQAEKRLMEKFFPSKVLENMESVRKVVTLALEARMKANVKVRQPLSKLSIKTELPAEYLEIIKDELNVKDVVVDKTLSEEVLLDTVLTPELEEEGRVRDAIRAVQEWRKEQNLKPGETAHYSVPEELRELFSKHSEMIKSATSIEF